MHTKDILHELTNDIALRRFSDDGKLPSEAALCKRFGVSRMTIRNVLDELRRSGYIEKRMGVGSFLTPRARRKSGIIGLIIPDLRDFAFLNTLRAELERHCRRLNYHIELVTTQETNHHAAVSDIRHKVRGLAGLRAEGAIFRPYVADQHYDASQEIVRILNHAEIPVVLIDADVMRPPKRSDCDIVAVDNVAAGRRIADHLFQRGYHKPTFLTGNGHTSLNANWGNRLFGLAGEFALLGVEHAVRTLCINPNAAKDISAMMQRRNHPDAIVCGNDEMANQLVQTLRKIGKRIPHDVAVVGFDNSETAVRANLTTILQPTEKISATAFKTLLARIRYPNGSPRETYLPAPLIVRGTT